MIAIFVFTREPKTFLTPFMFSRDFHSVQLFICSQREWVRFHFRNGYMRPAVLPWDYAHLNKVLERLPSLVSYLEVSIDNPTSRKWFPLTVQSCNEFVRFLTGVDIGFTCNPVHLYKKLLKYDGIRNYHILKRRDKLDGQIRQGRRRERPAE